MSLSAVFLPCDRFHYRAVGPPRQHARPHGKQCAGNAIDDSVRQQALLLVQARYADFSPTFAHEKLVELHRLCFSVETLRRWMMTEGLWQAKSRKQAHIHQRHPRRPRIGEISLS